jgi:Fe-S oxidoreductase
MQACELELGVDMAPLRIRDALAVGAEIISSPCPACKDNLRKGASGLPKKKRGTIKTLDAAEMVFDTVN